MRGSAATPILTTFAVVAALGSLAVAQGVYNGRYCGPGRAGGYFGYELSVDDTTFPGSVSYGFNQGDYVCTSAGEAIISPIWSVDLNDHQKDWADISIGYLGLDWAYASSMKVTFDGMTISRKIDSSRDYTVEKIPIENMDLNLSPEELFRIAHARQVTVAFGEINPVTFALPREVLFNLRQFTDFISEKYNLSY